MVQLLLLANPFLHIVFLSSMMIDPTIIDYLVSQVPGIPADHVRKRLHLFHAADSSPTLTLTEKILARPRLIRRIRKLLDSIGDHGQIHMACFCVTGAERTLAVELRVPIYGCDPELLYLGTKSGSRQMFREAGIGFAPGQEDLKSGAEVIEALARLKADNPDLTKAVVKLNEGFSGEGNAVFSYEGCVASDDQVALVAWVADAVQSPAFRPEAKSESWDSFASKMEVMGGIVEAFVGSGGTPGEVVVSSPSVQIRVAPDGEVIVVSTHEQILEGQVYQGCEFPASDAYRTQLIEDGKKVGRLYSNAGVLGRFAIDFMVTRNDLGEHALYAIEVNLRRGGTSGPFATLHHLISGCIQPDGSYLTPQGQPRTYVACDTVQSDAYRGLLPLDLIDLIVEERLIFDPSRASGVVFHNISGLSQFGKIGVLAIAPDIHAAHQLYDRTLALFDDFAADSECL